MPETSPDVHDVPGVPGVRPAPRGVVRRLVRAGQLLGVTALLGGAVLASHPGSADGAGGVGGAGGPEAEAAGRLPACAAPGATAAAGQVAAVVRGPGGRVRTVSFEQGWQVYRGERPGALVAVCRTAGGGTPGSR